MMDASTAIVGIGATEFSKDSGRSELQLAAEAVREALADAGLHPSDVDGLVTFTMDANSEIAVARELGIPSLSFFSRVGYGGGAACATVQQAAMAVATGMAEVVVCYRAFNERSGSRFGRVQTAAAAEPTSGRHRQQLALPDGPRHAGGDRGDVRAPVHARVRRDERGLRRVAVADRGTPRRTRRRGSTTARSPWRTTRHPAGSRNRCGCWTAARKATARWHWW